MSKKRFSLKYLDNMPYVKDNLNGDEYYLYWAVEWMNELIEENEVLKEDNEQLQTELNNYEKITNLLADYDVHHYNRWINQIKNYVEKTNEGFEYNREFIIKLCLSYTLQSLRHGENLKRFQWGMINDN